MNDAKRVAISMGIFGGSMWLLGFIAGHTVGSTNHNWLNGYAKGYFSGAEDGSKKKEDK